MNKEVLFYCYEDLQTWLKIHYNDITIKEYESTPLDFDGEYVNNEACFKIVYQENKCR